MAIETIQYLTTIRFGEGASRDLPVELEGMGVSRPLVVTDAALRALGLVDRLVEGIAPAPPVFDGTPSNPTEEAVNDAAAFYEETSCDGIVAIGGGSPIDLAKAVALRVTHHGPLSQYAVIEGGLTRITDRVAPVIAIPTTAGTGSEVGRASLLTLADGRKLGLISPHLIPRLAICDPELTYCLPPGLTAATGMDAITHCIETYLSPRVNPPAEAIALDGLRRCWTQIKRAVSNGSDKDARRDMLMGSLQGGLTFQKGLGAVHSLSHPLGALRDVNPHHGTLNAILLPHVLRFNRPAMAEKTAFLRTAMMLSAGDDLADAVTALLGRIGMPTTLSEIGIQPSVFPAIAEHAVRDHSTPTNVRPCTAEDLIAILHTAA